MTSNCVQWKKKEFRIGDRVKIVTLDVPTKSSETHIGRVGHIGNVTHISDEGYYTLSPHCVGTAWKAECLEFADNHESEDSQNISKLFEEKVKQLQHGK